MIYFIAKIVGTYYTVKSLYEGGKIINTARKVYKRIYPKKTNPPPKNKIVIIDNSKIKTSKIIQYVSRGRSKSI